MMNRFNLGFSSH